jgi:hypothetical protein
MTAAVWIMESDMRINARSVLGAVLVLSCTGLACAQEKNATTAPAPPPITIGEKGVVLRDGKLYRAVGINYFSAFNRTMAKADDTSYEAGLDELAKRGIPFIRFSACPFWPKEYALYKDDPEAYFRRLDAFVKAAEARKIGLIPSLFWYDAAVPDVVGEPRSAWGDPNSKTIAFMRKYIAEVIGRYVNSPAIWAWELGNEYSLDADLPNAAQHRPWIVPTLGTPTERTPADDLTFAMILTVCREFGNAVRQIDKVHPITTGHSLPRNAAEHLRRELTWKQDTPEELVQNLVDVTPDPNNLISVHVYPFGAEKRFNQEETSYLEVLQLCMKASEQSGKGLFVGEFGAADDEKNGGPEKARVEFGKLLAAIEETGVPLSALWVFDLPFQESFVNISTTNARSWQLGELEKANQRLKEKGYQ